MKPINKKLIVLIGLCCLFLLIFSKPNSDKNVERKEIDDNDSFEPIHLKNSQALAKIHIDNNWSGAKAVGICTGEGSCEV